MMNLGSEAKIQWEIEKMLQRDQISREAKIGFWKKRDGTIINVKDMTTEHILNAITMLKRMDCEDMYLPWICRFEDELRERE